MLVNGDIVRFTVNQSLTTTGAVIINVFHYQAAAITGTISTVAQYEAMITDFMASVMSHFAFFQSEDLSYVSTTLDNVTNLVDQTTYTATSPTEGDFAGPSNSGQTALSFKLIRTNRSTRNGSKRLGGVADGQLDTADGSNLVGSVPIGNITAALAATLPMVLPSAAGVDLIPVIARKPALGLPVTVFNPIASAEYRGVGSQNSRKELL